MSVSGPPSSQRSADNHSMNHHSLEDRSVALVVGLTLVLAALTALASLVAALYGISGGFLLTIAVYPGHVLFRSFHAAAFFVPVFVLVHGLLLLRRSASRAAIMVLNATVLPFLSGAVALRLWLEPSGTGSPLLSVVTANFSRLGGALMFTLLTVLFVVAILRMLMGGGTADEEDRLHAAGDERAGGDPGGEDAPIDDPEHRNSPWPAAPPGGLLTPRIRTLLRRASSGSDSHERPARESEPGRSDTPAAAREYGADLEELEMPAALRHNHELLQELEAVDPVDDDGRNTEVNESYRPDAEWGAGDVPEDEFAPGIGDHAGDPAIELTGSQRAARASAPQRPYAIPLEGVLKQYRGTDYGDIDDETRHAAEMLQITLEEFKIQAEVTGIRKGPVITMFELLPAPGVKLARITNLADNIALRLAASSVRIVAPIPGKHAVGIEIPNKRRAIVPFGQVVRDEEFGEDEYEIPLAIGKDIPGDPQIIDLTGTPHLLIAGATGSGKSVCVNSIICSILYRRSPAEVKLMLIDPKIVELKFYNDIPHLLTPVITDPKRAFEALQYCIYEMERRYSLLDALGVRDIRSYNAKIKTQQIATEPLPYVVVIVDEFADLMATSGKELESTVARLASMSRAVGIHLVLATQRPSTDVITGLIKANIPSRIAFMVASKVDSRIIIDAVGAEKLLGKGDMLFASAWDPFPYRIQGAFLSESEVERVVKEVKRYGEPEYIDDEIFVDDEDEDFAQQELEDPLMERAMEIVTSANKASASYLQRRLKIGYNRAARLIEEMERIGVVGPQQGSKPRDILHVPDHV